MIYNNIRIAIRNILKNPLYSFINIMGLAIGFTFVFLILLWVKDEMSIDKFHKNEENLVQVMETSVEAGALRVHNSTQGPLAKALEKDFPEVETGLTVLDIAQEKMKVTFTYEDEVFSSSGIFASDKFFSVFSFPLLYGDPETALTAKNNVVISESMSIKLFGSGEAAVGKTVTYSLFGTDILAKVTGVSATSDQQSTLKFDFVITDKVLFEDVWPQGNLWTNEGPQTYLQLTENTDLQAFESKIKDYILTHDPNSGFSLFLRKYSDAYLYNEYENGEQAGGRIMVVKLFLLIALLILFIACINFMNLSTARASTRLKEIGIKKVVGGKRSTLILQFLSESVIFSFFAFGLAVLMMWVAMPIFNSIVGKSLSINPDIGNFVVCLSIVTGAGLLAGSYPALYMSGFKPIESLKGKFTSKTSELFIRRGLVVFQFVVSLVLIISALIIRKQINYAVNKPMGIEKENLVFFNLEGKAHSNLEAFILGLEKIKGVESTGAISSSLISEDGGSSTYGVEWPGSDGVDIDFTIRDVDHNLLPTMGITLAEGRNFTAQDTGKNYLLFNEEAIRVMNLDNPVGQEVVLWGNKSEIIGVMNDFHTKSVLSKIPPVVFQMRHQNLSQAVLKLDEAQLTSALSEITRFYQSFNPGFDVNYQFMDETIEAQYLSEKSILKMATYFSYMAILISCLGLLGLASFNTFLRMKEIGVRKILGASSISILQLLSKDFIKLVLLSLLIAIPLTLWVMNLWLEQFAYKVEMSWKEFVLAGVVAIFVAFLTVILQSMRAAISSPIKSIQRD